ncbi:hypothetical protein VCRA2123E76_50202 [Vibrio crassostreae]|nr:hypothetical protein VCRA2123E76_50202 [Vibrio crassostreae]
MLGKVKAWSIKVRKFLQCKNRLNPYGVRVGKQLLYSIRGIGRATYNCNK